MRDAIGDRLDHPERVPEGLRHLIADDVQRVQRILEFEPVGPALDYGCSDGAVSARIRNRWDTLVVGWDIDPQAREDARARGIPVPDREPTVWPGTVYLTEVLEHLQHPEWVCEAYDDLIITTPNRTPHYDYVREGRSRWAWPTHVREWTCRTLMDMLSRAGFTRQAWVPLYDGESPDESIYLIVRARRFRA